MADYQRYNHAGIDQAANELQQTATKLRNRLDLFVADVKKELPQWEGESARAFDTFHQRWNKEIDELQTFAASLPGLVNDINQRAISTDKAGAGLFQ
jgi:WXG100 family type VII secretion target